MKIRKLLLMIVLITIGATVFSACEKEDPEEDPVTTGNDIVGTWITPSCGFADAATWYFGSDGKGSLTTRDCNGICNPTVLKFSYTVSGNTLNSVYDANQDPVYCEGYGESPIGSPGTTSQNFDLNGNSLTVSAGGTTSVFTRSGTGGGTTGGGTTATTGNVSFWTKTDLGCGNITVNVNGQSGSITGYNTGGVSTCNVSGGANFTLPAGNYNYTASCSGGDTWSGTIAVTAGGCLLQQLTASNNGGGTTTTGSVTVWTRTDLGCGNITVSIGGKSALITSYYANGVTSCEASASATINLPAGSYAMSASCSGGKTWSGTANITSGGCQLIELHN
jgi:hypothetical protein